MNSVHSWSRRPGFNPRLSHTKDSKMVLDATLLNTQHYKVRIKGKVEQSREWSSAPPTPWCSSNWKGSLWVTLDFSRQLYFFYKSDLIDKMKRSFFQAAVVSILLYGCTTWTLTKRLEKKLDGNYTRMLQAILNKSWQQHPKRHQLYGHLTTIMKTIQARRTRHAGHCWRSRDELISDPIYPTPPLG